MLRAWRGIPEEKNEIVVCLYLAAWIEQARAEQHDGAWLRRHALKLHERFAKLPADAWANALANAGAEIEAAKLVVAAGLHNDANTLAGSAQTLRYRTKQQSK